LSNHLRNSRNFFLIFLLFVLLATVSRFFYSDQNSLNRAGRKIEKNIRQKEISIDKLLNSSLLDSAIRYSSLSEKNTDLWKRLNQTFYGEGVILLTYKNNELVYWSSAKVVPEKKISDLKEGNNFQRLDNGWYLIRKKNISGHTILVLLSIKKEYNYQNEYLKNQFSSKLGFPDYIELSTQSKSNTYPIKDTGGTTLFNIGINEQTLIRTPIYYMVLVWMLAFFFLYLSINSFARHLWSKGEWLAGLLTIISSVIIFRAITMFWEIPKVLYKLDVFSPQYYASNFLFPSLGDLIFNLLLFHWIVYFFYEKGKDLNIKVNNVRRSYFITFIFICSTFLFVDLLNYLFEGLIMNSNISFDVTNILSLNLYSALGFFILGLTLYTFFLFTDILITIFHQFFLSKQEKFAVFTISIVIILVTKLLVDEITILMITNTLFLIILERSKTRKKEYLTFPTVVLILTIFSFGAASRLNDFNISKEKENRRLLASKLESANDPIAEYLLEGLVKKIQSDKEVKAHFEIQSTNNEIIYNRIQQLYFGGYFSKYDLGIYEFKNDGKPFNSNSTRDLNYFVDLIRLQCTPTANDYFYYLSNSYGILTYYGNIPIVDSTGKVGTLIIELKSKYFRDDNIFPELLLEGGLKLNKDFQTYSYSIYKQERLVSQQGDYPYSLRSTEFGNISEDYTFLTRNNYDHLVYKPNSQLMIVVSKPEDSAFKILAVFSYIFGILSLLLFIFYLRRVITKNASSLTFDYQDLRQRVRILFKTRIQVSMVLGVISSAILIGYITFLYISEQYNKQQYDRIEQKVRSILISLEKRTSTLNYFNIHFDENLALELKNLSDLYTTDINIFDLNGNLIVSSQPKIFEEGLISRKMNPQAYIELKRYARSEFTTNEKIGALNYLSSYAPIRNINNKTIAYLNLPYFANKTEYEARVSQFFTAFINVYVFIFVMIGFVAFFLANSITLPLTLIEQQLRETKIGKKMEPIIWKRKDEIGTLINEYNRMIRELESNTEKLAKSERENAWREMAKQVAHEIKNPLTPIKLSVQQMERLWKEKDPTFDEKFEKFSKTIIQQIESLSIIASEFSNFAQMPAAKSEKVDVKEIIKNVVNLYKSSTDIQINLGYLPSLRSVVLADRDHMIRTFNNLIKNAIQAIPTERKGIIDIELLNDKGMLLVMLQDNGIGIEEGVKGKIFEPNFTTKNSGMGMGLAIISNIIINIGGKIWFNSTVNKGTTFFVSLPLYMDNE
jgi:two-component system, NtrC family, nitrogen regulation sensor histidine kinase NtrY